MILIILLLNDQELQSLKEQVSSRQASYDQMVHYQKELQSRLDHQETERLELEARLHQHQEEAAGARQQVEQLRLANIRQVEHLKQDLEVKIR
jgi:hypothetical protein